MDKKSTAQAKALRRKQTDAENLLWRQLRAKRFDGLKFRRQQPIGKYIVDFVCLEKKIVIELDGGGHAIWPARDKIRDEWLRNEGYLVMRFWNNELYKNLEGVLITIWHKCNQE